MRQFLCGVSFDVLVSNEVGLGFLPVDLELEIPEDLLSMECLEAIENDRTEMGLCGAVLTHVAILKMVSGDTYGLFDVVLNSGTDPQDFFALRQDEAGSFIVGLGLLVADTSAENVSAVQAVPVSGDCRFLVFDGVDDGYYRDPIVAVAKDSGNGNGSGGGTPYRSRASLCCCCRS